MLASGVAVSLLSACASTGGAVRPAGGPGTTAPVSLTASLAPTPMTPLAAAVIESALALRGTRYRLGGQTPKTGFDCSGFVGYVLRLHSIDIPRTVAGQFTAGQAVGRDALHPGDLVFFSTTGSGPTHVGIVLGASGRLEFVHAPVDGSSVRVERFDTAYWDRRWVGARRVF